MREALDWAERGVGRVFELFATPEAAQRHVEAWQRAGVAGIPTSLITEKAAAGLSETVTPQGLVAVCGLVDVPLATALTGSPRLVAVLVEIADPGNAGTVLRVADAAGADAVIFAGSAVDPHNGKCVRATTGSLFHLPVARERDVDAVLAACRAAGLRLVAADGRADQDLDAADRAGDLAAPTAWLFGSEAHGLSSEVRSSADTTLAVPLHGRAESLNLATAAAVCLYATARAQRA
ncbi:rRNA methylase [Actinoalloteichus sp. GBA129-24]|uniref:rRNA methylase n=1 Tax=Actinoalloteichus fjordicus TaxID=1612552 RepID=A0AAC9LGC5_9PSEU|nr:rRNA methylase [Actinoalloteichus fjordicus]APU22417.1 rRNA methylase [Actinoalloteichus sp. GBA129-24]